MKRAFCTGSSTLLRSKSVLCYIASESNTSILPERSIRQPVYKWPEEQHLARMHAGLSNSVRLLPSSITPWFLTRIVFVPMSQFRLDDLLSGCICHDSVSPVLSFRALLVEYSGGRLSCLSGVQISAAATWLYHPEHSSRPTGLNLGQLGQSRSLGG